jgi:hypothetical protein
LSASLEREKARLDWEQDPAPQEERAEMKERCRLVVVDNVTSANVFFPPHQSWFQARIERDRNARISVRQDEDNGRVATLTDLD